MDERLEKAFAVANYMTTLSNQRRIILEEFNQNTVFYTNGATFKINPELITFTKAALDMGHTHDVAFLDTNNFPVIIPDVQDFFNEITFKYFSSLNEYASKYADIKSKRKIADIVEL